MAEYVHLLGAEDVRAAGNAMRSAADDMRQAASSIDSVLERHQRFLDDWLIRFTEAMQIASPAGETIRSAQDEAMEPVPATGQLPVGAGSPIWAPTHQHLKTRGLYRVVIGHAYIEATMEAAVVYDNAEGMTFIRPSSEFHDGRFLLLTGGDHG